MPSLGDMLTSARQFRHEGNLRQAEQLYRQILEAAPSIAAFHYDLGIVLQEQGRLVEAAVCYQQAIHHKPDLAQAHNNLGNILIDQNKLERAVMHFQRALRVDPKYAEAHNNLGIALTKLGRLAEAAASCQRALLLLPNCARAHCNLWHVFLQQGRIDQALACYQQALRCNPYCQVYLNMEVLLRTIGRREEAIACARQAVRLQPQRAECYLHLGSALQEQGQTEEAVATYRHALCLKPEMSEAATAPKQMLGDREGNAPDAHAFLAQGIRVGCTDRLRVALATCLPVIYQYYRPEQTAPHKGRADFGLPLDAHVYTCPQSLFKIHPQFDEILAGILRGDPKAILVMGFAIDPLWEQLLRQRFATNMPDVVARIRFFLNKLSRDDFLNLLTVVDVLLDPLHFGGNSSYEGLAFGVPIVTLPSQFLRGRITFALYQQMQVLDCVTRSSQEYIALALRPGTDLDYREAVRAKILAANSVLYENSAGIRELEQFFERVAS